MRVEPFLEDAVGMQQDGGRDEVPPGYVWSMTDFNPRLGGAAIRGRGAWSLVSQALPVSAPTGLVWAPYLAGAKLLAVAGNGEVYDVPLAGPTATLVMTPSPMTKQNPVFYRDKVYLPADGSACATLAYTPVGAPAFVGSSLPGSALQGRHATFYRERLVLARSLTNPSRVAFSKPGDPTLAWNSASYIDSSDTVNGVYGMRNQILVMHSAYVEQIRGTTPPDTSLSDPLGDMQLGVLWERAGCFDARSIAAWQGNVIFADERGVHITDGGLVRNMITQGGIERLWRTTFDPGTIQAIGAVVVGDHYIASTRASTGNSYVWVCHIPTRRWWRWKNIDAASMAVTTTAPERIYATNSSSRRVMNLTNCLAHDNTVDQVDGDGDPVLPEMETGWLRLSKRVGLRRIYDLFAYYLGYSAVDPGTDLIEVSMIDDPEDTVYEVVGGLKETTSSERRKLLVARQAEGVAFKVRALRAHRDLRLHSIGVSVEAEEEHRIR